MLGGNAAAMMGQTIMIRGIPFEIIGVLSRKGSAGSFQNPDEQILIPLQTARYRIFGTDRLRSMTVQVADGVPLEQGMVDFERVLRREHKIRPGGDNDFQVRNQQDILATQQQATQVFTALLASIAGGEPPRGRHRHHEHHAGVGHRADPGDRRPQGARRHAGQHP